MDLSRISSGSTSASLYANQAARAAMTGRPEEAANQRSYSGASEGGSTRVQLSASAQARLAAENQTQGAGTTPPAATPPSLAAQNQQAVMQTAGMAQSQQFAVAPQPTPQAANVPVQGVNTDTAVRASSSSTASTTADASNASQASRLQAEQTAQQRQQEVRQTVQRDQQEENQRNNVSLQAANGVTAYQRIFAS